MPKQSNVVQHILSQAAGSHVRQAISHLARAAACEQQLLDGSNNEAQLWFLVRALCHEHGVDYQTEVVHARAYAAAVEAC